MPAIVLARGAVHGSHSTSQKIWINPARAKFAGKQLVFTITLERQTAGEKHIEIRFNIAGSPRVSRTVVLNSTGSFVFDAETVDEAEIVGHGAGSDGYRAVYEIVLIEDCDKGSGRPDTNPRPVGGGRVPGSDEDLKDLP